MPFIVETGAGLTDSTSYVSEDDADSYFEDRATSAWTDSTEDKEAALIRATQALDAIYRKRYPGTRTLGRAQALEWPRQDAVDAEGLEVGDDEIPIEIIEATCELAVRELVSPGSVLPDLERGGSIRRIQAGSVAIEYGDNAQTVTTLQLIDGILSPLIGGSARSGALTGVAARG
jgi:hypothetical protein